MNDICPHCGGATTVPAISRSEVFLNVACALLALAVSISIFRVADHWLDIQMEKISNHMVWREPLQSWD